MKTKLIDKVSNTIVSEVELIYKTNIKPSERIKIEDSKKVYEVLKTVYDYNKIEHKESFYAMYLNRANKILAVILISEGGTSACLVDVKLIFQAALKLNASGIINYYNKSYINETFDTKANKTDVYTKTQLDDKFNENKIKILITRYQSLMLIHYKNL